MVGGEAFIDLVPGGVAPDGQPLLRPARGGGPYNTAVALGRLGASVAYCSRVSTDTFGESLVAGLREAGVDISLLQRGDEPSTLTVPGLAADGSASYSFYVQGTADRLFALPSALPADTQAVCVGTCSMVLEPGASAYEAMLRREAARGVFTLLDPNIRDGLIPDAEAYRERFRSWLPDVAMLKLSVDDAEWLAPGRSVLAAAKEWLAFGPEVVVLTRGGDGLAAVTPGGVHEVGGVAVEVVDTIGAGDTVNAALLHGLGERGALSREGVRGLGAEGWDELLRFAARAAAVTCSRPGARPPFASELRS